MRHALMIEGEEQLIAACLRTLEDGSLQGEWKAFPWGKRALLRFERERDVTDSETVCRGGGLTVRRIGERPH